MGILLIHLSDAHFGANNFIKKEHIDKMVESISNVDDFDKCLILFTGDIAHSCQRKEYVEASWLLNKFQESIKKRYQNVTSVTIFVIPGNHDIDFDSKNMNRNMVSKALASGETETITQEYLEKMKEFYEFSAKYNCFIKDKFIDFKTIKYDDHEIGLTLINSSLFSLFKDNDKDNDKGLHYISKKSMEKLARYNKKDINIMLIHHSPKFFETSVEDQLDSFISKNIDFILYGHEHVNTKQEIIKKGTKIEQSRCGGPFSDGVTSIFNSILIDMREMKHQAFQHQWTDDFYNVTCEQGSFNKISNGSQYLKAEYVQELEVYNSILLGATVDDIFVFPDLLDSRKDYSSTDKVTTIEKFYEIIEEKDICIIEGSNGSGKSALSKKIFLHYAKNKYPLLISANDFQIGKSEKIIETIYRSSYDDKELHYGKFKQFDKKDKILIIDDSHRVNNEILEQHVKDFRKHFGKIVIFSSMTSDFKIFESAMKDLIQSDAFVRLRISDLYYEKRKELITKVIRFNKKNGLKESEVENLINRINNAIKNQLNIINLTPDFIILFVNSFLNSGYQTGGSNVFNSVFVSNITSMLKRDKTIDVNSTLYILQLIAYYIHSNKEYPINQSNIIKVISGYNDSGKKNRKQINPLELISKLIGVKIIRFLNEKGDIVFDSNNYLSYFIAKEMLRRLVIDSANETLVIERVINNVCFGINSDILLFLCYLIDNTNVLGTIIKKSKDFFNDKEQINFDSRNVAFLERDKYNENHTVPTISDRKSSIENIEKQEKEINTQKKTVIDIYDYDESKLNEQISIITSAYKYIEIISKILPDFIHLLNDDEIEDFVNAVYIYPNQLLYLVLKPFDSFLNVSKEEFDVIVNKDLTSVDDYIDQKQFLNEIQKLSRLLILNIYNNAVKLSTQIETIGALESFDYKHNTNYRLMNAMMYENLAETEKMGKRLESIDKDNKKIYITNMIKTIIKKHYVYTKLTYVGYTQHLVDKYLTAENKDTISMKKVIKQ